MDRKKIDWTLFALRPHDLSMTELSAGIENLLSEAGKQWELALVYREEFYAALALRKRRWPNMSAGAVLRLAYLAAKASAQSLRRAEALIGEVAARIDAEHAEFSPARATSLPAPRTPGKRKASKRQKNAGKVRERLKIKG